MKNDFINLTEENVSDEHLCCIIRSRKPHSGISAKREWLSDRLKEGHVFRKLNVKGTVFIEYAPLETAWVPIEGSRYYYIYCLWATGEYKGKGYGKQLLEYCIADAKANGKSGICVLGAKKQKAWLSGCGYYRKRLWAAGTILWWDISATLWSCEKRENYKSGPYCFLWYAVSIYTEKCRYRKAVLWKAWYPRSISFGWYIRKSKSCALCF